MPSTESSFSAALLDENKAAYLWWEVVDRFVDQLDQNAEGLENEADSLDLGNPALLIHLLRQKDPRKALLAYRDQNPDVDLNNLPGNDPYQVAVGCLNLLAYPE